MRLVDIDTLHFNGCYEVAPWISASQLVEAVRKPAVWRVRDNGFVELYSCSECGRVAEYRTPFCPYCGREMNSDDT